MFKTNIKNMNIFCMLKNLPENVVYDIFQKYLDGKVVNDLCEYAAENGLLNMFKTATMGGCKKEKRVCTLIIRCGHLSLLNYAIENGYPCDSSVYTKLSEYAAMNNLLNILMLATKRGCIKDKSVTYYAAIGGHLLCLIYAHENGYPWDQGTLYLAAWYSKLDCLKYLHENGCPYDYYTLYRPYDKLYKLKEDNPKKYYATQKRVSKINSYILSEMKYKKIDDNDCNDHIIWGLNYYEKQFKKKSKYQSICF